MRPFFVTMFAACAKKIRLKPISHPSQPVGFSLFSCYVAG